MLHLIHLEMCIHFTIPEEGPYVNLLLFLLKCCLLSQSNTGFTVTSLFMYGEGALAE